MITTSKMLNNIKTQFKDEITYIQTCKSPYVGTSAIRITNISEETLKKINGVLIQKAAFDRTKCGCVRTFSDGIIMIDLETLTLNVIFNCDEKEFMNRMIDFISSSVIE